MDKNHENKQTMNLSVLSLFDEKASKIADFTALKARVEDFRKTVQAVKDKSLDVEQATAGKTRDKWDAEEALFEVLLPAKGALASLARKTGDNAMLEKASISEWGLRRMRDTDLVTASTELQELAEKHASELADYQVTASEIADLKSKIEAYHSSIGGRESSVANRVGSRLTLKALFNETNAILEDIDDMMERFRTKDAEFYDQYFSARQVKQTGVRYRPEPAPTQQAAPQPAK